MGVLEQNKKRGMLLGQEGNALVLLVAINAFVFILINFIKIGYSLGNLPEPSFYTQVLNKFTLPVGGGQFFSHPWTLFSYMFTHVDVWHIVSNMLWLWGFGYILQDLTGNRLIGPLYLYGGLAGALTFLVVVNAFPALHGALPLMGGGAAIMAVAIATTTLAPKYRIFPMLNGGIPVWILTLIFVAIDYALVARSQPAMALAHLAGGLVGLFYMLSYRRGSDWGHWMHRLYYWAFNVFEPKTGQERQKIKQEIFYQQGHHAPYKKSPNVTQQRIDEILDKINQKGYNHLNEEEKEYLRRASKEGL